MSCDVDEATESFDNEQSLFSNLSVASPTSQLILQPLRRFTYVRAHSPTLPLLRIRHSSFSNPSFASPTSAAFHLRHLASRPWDKCQETLGPQAPRPRTSFGRHNHHFIFALLEWMSVFLVCIVFHVRVVSEVAPAFSWSLIRGVLVWSKKYICLISSPNRSWLCKARAAWVT